MGIEEQARELQARGVRQLNGLGLMLPKDVRNLLADLLAMVAQLAAEVEKGRGGK